MNYVFTGSVGSAVAPNLEDRAPFRAILAFLAGSVLGSLASGGMLVLLSGQLLAAGGGAVQATMYGALLVLGVAASLLEFGGRLRPLPERNAQLPRRWLSRMSLSRAAAGFGFVLGAAIFTRLHHATMYTLAVVIAIAPAHALGVLVGLTYGVGKGAQLTYRWHRGSGDGGWGTPTRRLLNHALGSIGIVSLSVAVLVQV